MTEQQNGESTLWKCLQRTVSHALLTVVGLWVCTGCETHSPVMRSKTSPVIDFIEEEEGLRNDKTDTTVYGIRRLRSDVDPLIPEYFDPYVPLADEYVLSQGDVLEISIFGDQDTVVNEVVVAPDGRIYYMFLPGVLAEGRTVDAVREAIEEAVQAYFVNPEISVLPKKVAGQSFTILGKVRRAGVYPINGSLTIRQAIGEAGGVSFGSYAATTINAANLRESFIVRNGRKLDVDFEKLVNTDGFDQNIFVRPGDYIYIASSLVQEVFLIGEVREQKPMPFKDGLTLTAVLAGVAGSTEGWKDTAHIRQVLIVRGSLDNPVAYQIDVLDILSGQARDVFLLPGDIVYVQKKPMEFGRELVRLAIESFVRTFSGTAGIHFMEDHWIGDGD